MLAANSSILMFCFGMPASCSAAETPCIMSSGPQMKATSMSSARTQCCRNCAAFSLVMRPLNSSMSCCSRLIT
jgi:hypothetical protein